MPDLSPATLGKLTRKSREILTGADDMLATFESIGRQCKQVGFKAKDWNALEADIQKKSDNSESLRTHTYGGAKVVVYP